MWAHNNFNSTVSAGLGGTNLDRQIELAKIIAACQQTIAIQQVHDLLKEAMEKEQII